MSAHSWQAKYIKICKQGLPVYVVFKRVFDRTTSVQQPESICNMVYLAMILQYLHEPPKQAFRLVVGKYLRQLEELFAKIQRCNLI